MSAAVEGVLVQADDIMRKDGQGLTLGQLQALQGALAAPLARDLAAVQADIVAWQRATFGPDSALAVQGSFKKLEKETHEFALELVAADYAATPTTAAEWADCLICLLGIGGRLGLNAYAEVTAKMVVNRARRWPPLAMQTPGQPVQHLAVETTQL